ncbi:DUF1365 domain-containing protein [Nocardia sp. NPDC050435]|uniref:DUF1365 domain-containing protein n=1 Tax=Nocardia sp. NPDC050435 TaxID=3155040 RepID=UPI0033CE5603
MTIAPALYFTRIHHLRRAPVRHAFEYRSYSWFFDVDAPPKLPLPLRPFGYFRAADHLEGPGADLRTRVRTFLLDNGIDSDGPITALMNARALGYVFDPLTLFWCHDRDGALRCVIAEVHNTYGQRHAYLVRPDPHGRDEVEKRFHVSPFNRLEGRYELHVPEPADDLTVRIALLRDGQPPFHAAVTGHRLPVTPRTILRAQLRTPLSPWLTAARIRRHGIALWARGLPVAPRACSPAPRKVQ